MQLNLKEGPKPEWLPRRVRNILLVNLLLIIGWWLIFWFVSLEPRFYVWKEHTRLVFSALYVISSMVISPIMGMIEDEES